MAQRPGGDPPYRVAALSGGSKRLPSKALGIERRAQGPDTSEGLVWLARRSLPEFRRQGEIWLESCLLLICSPVNPPN